MKKIMVLGNGLLVNKSFLTAPKFLLKTESSYRWKQFVTFTSKMLSKDVIHSWKEEDLDGRSDTVYNEYSLCIGVQFLHFGKFVFQQKKNFFFPLYCCCFIKLDQLTEKSREALSARDWAEIHNRGQRHFLVSRMSWCNVTAKIMKGLEPP